MCIMREPENQIGQLQTQNQQTSPPNQQVQAQVSPSLLWSIKDINIKTVMKHKHNLNI